MLDVDMFQAVEVGDFHQAAGVVIPLSRSVDLQLHTKVTPPFSVENRVGLVVIVVDLHLAAAGCVAAVAQGFLLIHIIPEKVGPIQMQDRPTAGTVGIVPIIAGGT